MPIDLAHPRRILPFSPTPPAKDGADFTPAPGTSPASHLGPPPARGQRALQLKLNQDVLAKLVQLAKAKGGTGKGKIQLDLRPGHQPAIIIDGVSHPLELHPEPPHSEVVRVSPASRDLEPIATISHKATLKVDERAERMAKASLNLKASREKEEREKESKKAVLLDSAPSTSSARSTSSVSRTRPSQLVAAAATSPPSRPASPANPAPVPSVSSQPKHASRLIATGPKPPGTSFRIGKGSIPLSIISQQQQQQQSSLLHSTVPAAANRTSSSSSSSSTSSEHSTPRIPSPQPPQVASSSSNKDQPRQQEPAREPPTRQFSSSSCSETSTSGNSSSSGSNASLSLLSNPSTLGTSPESILIPLNSSTVGGGGAGGGGGILKGKESLKKDAAAAAAKNKRKKEEDRSDKVKSKEKQSGRADKKSSGSSLKGKGKEVIRGGEGEESEGGLVVGDDGDTDADGEIDEEMMGTVEPGRTRDGREDGEGERARNEENNAKKKRKLLNGLAVESGGRGAEGRTSRNGSRERDKEKSSIKTVVKKVVSTTTASESEGRSKSEQHRGREPSARERNRGTGVEKEKEREKEKTKKRKKQETSRWYSSDEDEDPPAPRQSDPGSTLTSSYVDSNGSHRDSARLPPPPSPRVTGHLVSTTHSSPIRHSTRARFFELYAPYAVLHSRLSSIRSALERGQSIGETPNQLRTLVEECEKRRVELEGLKQGLRRVKS